MTCNGCSSVQGEAAAVVAIVYNKVRGKTGRKVLKIYGISLLFIFISVVDLLGDWEID